MIPLYAKAMGKSQTKHLLLPSYKDAEKLWKVKVIAARQADSSLIHVRVNLKGETPSKF